MFETCITKLQLSTVKQLLKTDHCLAEHIQPRGGLFLTNQGVHPLTTNHHHHADSFAALLN